MRRTVLAAGLLLAALVNTVEAQLVVEITEGIKRRPVAVVPFAWEGNTPEMPTYVSSVIAADLERSGRFRTIPEEDMLQKPTSGAEMDFDDWAILDVEAVVVGRVLQTAENAYSVQFQLFDVYGRKQLVGYRMPASRGTMRRAAHRLADMIKAKLAAKRGGGRRPHARGAEPRRADPGRRHRVPGHRPRAAGQDGAGREPHRAARGGPRDRRRLRRD